MLFALSPALMIVILVLFVSVLGYSLFLVMKHEQSYLKFLWILFVLFFPFIGPLIYIGNHFVNKKVVGG